MRWRRTSSRTPSWPSQRPSTPSPPSLTMTQFSFEFFVIPTKPALKFGWQIPLELNGIKDEEALRHRMADENSSLPVIHTLFFTGSVSVFASCLRHLMNGDGGRYSVDGSGEATARSAANIGRLYIPFSGCVRVLCVCIYLLAVGPVLLVEPKAKGLVDTCARIQLLRMNI